MEGSGSLHQAIIHTCAAPFISSCQCPFVSLLLSCSPLPVTSHFQVQACMRRVPVCRSVFLLSLLRCVCTCKSVCLCCWVHHPWGRLHSVLGVTCLNASQVITVPRNSECSCSKSHTFFQLDLLVWGIEPAGFSVLFSEQTCPLVQKAT